MTTRRTGPGLHAHGCQQCKGRYEDTCEEAKANGLCVECRTGKPGFRLLIESRLPRQCCVTNSRLVKTAAEKKTYDLAGDCAWYICAVCKRTHPFRVQLPKEQP